MLMNVSKLSRPKFGGVVRLRQIFLSVLQSACSGWSRQPGQQWL